MTNSALPGGSTEREYCFAPFRFVPSQQLLLHGDTPVRLGSRALDILAELVERPGEVVSKRELMARAWPASVVEESNLKVHVAALRRALCEDGRRIVADYRHAAQWAKDAGFDGVEVHAANCYLLEQFIRDSTNLRTDQYGGSVENRSRLPIEAVTAVAEVWGADRVGVRLSPITRAVGDTPLDSDPEGTYFYLAEQLGKLGLAYLHCVEGQTRGDNGAGDFDFKRLRASASGVPSRCGWRRRWRRWRSGKTG
ncbi:oxidoreductase [Massilia polaris]|uniref:oxidoreductase n=1 Tax=Massilia polaris TaxID=2728846 RepID=UPI001981F284